MRSVRTWVYERLPRSIARPARRLTRAVDQAVGFPFRGRRAGSVAMFHAGRCGSTVLGSLLGQHPRIYWDGEVYHRKWIAERRPFDGEKFLRRQMWVSRSRYYGFEIKMLADQHLSFIGLSLEDYVAQLQRIGVTHYVVLERRNYLRALISRILGTKTRRRHIKRGEAPSRETVQIDFERIGIGRGHEPKTLLAHFEELDRAYASLAELLAGEKLLRLTYEEDVLADGPFSGYRKICELLGIEPAAAEVQLERVNPYPVRELVENYEELQELLEGTDYKWMLDD